jgi:hypothetical protein
MAEFDISGFETSGSATRELGFRETKQKAKHNPQLTSKSRSDVDYRLMFCSIPFSGY